jgi:hypothetical protein
MLETSAPSELLCIEKEANKSLNQTVYISRMCLNKYSTNNDIITYFYSLPNAQYLYHCYNARTVYLYIQN